MREQPYRVLVIDDHEAILRHVADWVGTTGIATVTGLATGWDSARTQIAENTPDLVLCDVHMPGIDGFELCRRLRELHPTLPVLLFSARDDDTLRESATAAGATGLVSKTASTEQLSTAIRNAVGN